MGLLVKFYAFLIDSFVLIYISLHVKVLQPTWLSIVARGLAIIYVYYNVTAYAVACGFLWRTR